MSVSSSASGSTLTHPDNVLTINCANRPLSNTYDCIKGYST